MSRDVKIEKFFPFKGDKRKKNIISESSYFFFSLELLHVILNFYLYNKNEGKSLFETRVKNSTPFVYLS